MAEQALNITEKTVGDKTYYNIYPKHDLELGNHIVVTKIFADPLEVQGKYGPQYSWRVKLGEHEVSFLTNVMQNKELLECGGIDDSVKITRTERAVVNPKTKIKSLIPDMSFELVN